MIRKPFKIILLIFVLFSPVLINAQTKRALVIGLGQQLDHSWGKINGDKDIPLITEILENAGYKGNIVSLINETATKENIVSSFSRMADKCERGDIVYVHFSGHGQQMKDKDGDESDGKDECWIPYDAYRKWSENYNGENHLTDDELNIYLKNIRSKLGVEGKMLVVIDACHSGDSTRGKDGDEEVIRGVADIFERIMDNVKTYLWTPNQSLQTVAESKHTEPWITISACKSNQVNAELKSPAVGKLTYGLNKIIKEGKAISNAQIERAIYQYVNYNSPKGTQTPVVSGSDLTKYNIIDILR